MSYFTFAQGAPQDPLYLLEAIIQSTNNAESLKPFPGVALKEVTKLKPNEEHQLSADPIPTAQNILDGSYQRATMRPKDVVFYFPRKDIYTAEPSLTVAFSTNGRLGPCVKDLLMRRVEVDRASDPAFEGTKWSRTRLLIDWPGINERAISVQCGVGSGFYTDGEVAQKVVQELNSLMVHCRSGLIKQSIDETTQQWDIKRISPRNLRLIGINYYRRVWVPVLAIDTD